MIFVLQVSWYGLSGKVAPCIRVTELCDVLQACVIEQSIGAGIEDVLAPGPVPSYLAQRRFVIPRFHDPDTGLAAVGAAYIFVIEIWVRHCDALLVISTFIFLSPFRMMRSCIRAGWFPSARN